MIRPSILGTAKIVSCFYFPTRYCKIFQPILIKKKLCIKVFQIYEYWEDFGSNKNNLSQSRFNVR